MIKSAVGKPLSLRTRLSQASALALFLGSVVSFAALSQARAQDVSLSQDFSSLMRLGNVYEAGPEGRIIGAIRVEGAQRLERETILSYLTVEAGKRATLKDLDASLKALYATGLFDDVSLHMEDDLLIVTLKENPIVNHVSFEGNDAASDDDLQKEVKLEARHVYSLPRLQKDVERLLTLYRRQGRFAATVEPRVTSLPQNRVDIACEIKEGDRTGVESISFVGNEHFDEETLRNAISTRESAWWRLFTSADFYDPDRMNYDRELLRKFYLNHGYVDARILSSVAELTPDQKDFFLTFTIEEGPRYHFGAIKIDNQLKGVDPSSLEPLLVSHEGDWYKANAVEDSISLMAAALGDRQYAFVDIIPEVTRHEKERKVDITYHIKEGARIFIDKIKIRGNQRTEDRVIRREMELAEGDPFNRTKMEQSRQSIEDLGFFQSVDVTPVDGAYEDRADLNVTVTEKATGELAVGAGFSSTDGPLGDFSIREHNFMGRGQDVSLGATISGVTKQFDFSFTEPYFMGRDLSAGYDIFHTRTDNQDYSSYDQRNTGGTIRFGYPLSKTIRQRVTYTFQNTKIYNVPDTASRYIQEQVGTSTTSMVGQDLSYDTRDSTLNPTKGFVTSLGTDLAGLGGSRKYFRLRLSGVQYYPLAEDYVLSLTGEAGEIWGLGSGKVRINERFFLGGDTLRGFEYAGIGPRDVTDDESDALGGNRYVRTSIEVSMPTPVPSELGFKTHVFVDAGILGKNDETMDEDEVFMNEEDPRVGAGVGLSWQSPFGPIRLDFAWPLVKKSYDKTENIHFSFGTRF